jgi:pyruvate dehydrogenase E1 component alpha subunit
VIFVCENNQFAQTTPQSEHQKIKDVARRAIAYDMPAVTVDGNDVAKVYEAASKAAEIARQGDGPTFIECKTYRWRGHWEGDPQPYRTVEDVARWKEKCPINRFKDYLLSNNISTQQILDKIENEVARQLEQAVEFARKSPLPDVQEAYSDVFTVLE